MPEVNAIVASESTVENVDEIAPLLPTSIEPAERQLGECTSPGSQRENRLLLKDVLLLSLARLVDPLCFFTLVPFLPDMMIYVGVKESALGLYTGALESLFALMQTITMIGWGQLADRYGRKPTLIVSVLGLSAPILLLGISSKPWHIILFRCLAGVFSGDSVTIQAMAREKSTSQTQASMFSALACANNLGIFVGPLIGGLAGFRQKPAVYYAWPNVLARYPYLLPTLVASTYNVLVAAISATLLDESLRLQPETEPETLPKEHPSIRNMLSSKGLVSVLFVFGYCNILGLAYTAAPVFWYTDISLGGLGFTPARISLFLSIIGISQALWLVAFPHLQKRYGTRVFLNGCAWVWAIVFMLHPLSAIFLRFKWYICFWIASLSAITAGSAVSMTFTAVQLSLNDICPTPAVLGIVNALALTVTSGIRIIGPMAFASIYALGVKYRVFDGYLAWVVMEALAVGFGLAVKLLPRRREGPSLPPDDNGSDPHDSNHGFSNIFANRVERTTD